MHRNKCFSTHFLYCASSEVFLSLLENFSTGSRGTLLETVDKQNFFFSFLLKAGPQTVQLKLLFLVLPSVMSTSADSENESLRVCVSSRTAVLLPPSKVLNDGRIKKVSCSLTERRWAELPRGGGAHASGGRLMWKPAACRLPPAAAVAAAST